MRGFFNPLAQAPLASLVDGKRDSCHRSRSSTTPDTAVSPGWACSPPRDWVTTNGPADAAEHNRLQSYAASVAWAGELVSNATGTCCKICARESPGAGGVPEAVSASPVSTSCQCRGAAGGRCRRWRSPLVAEQVNVAMFEDFPILVPQDGEQHFVCQDRLRGSPVNVKEVRVGRAWAIFEHIVPPLIRRIANPHVIRDYIHHVVI
jgi:hypothetical protein